MMHPVADGVWEDRGRLYTESACPGKRVYGERLVCDGGTEFREWDPRRSKLSAYISVGGRDVPLGKGSRVLYLGASSGTTPSHVADIVRDGSVVCVEFAPRMFRELVRNSEGRPQMLPVLGDATKPDEYAMFAENIDVVYQDVAQKRQADILCDNMDRFGAPYGMVAVKARSEDVTAPPQRIFEEAERRIRERGYRILDARGIDPFEKDHEMIVVGRPRHEQDHLRRGVRREQALPDGLAPSPGRMGDARGPCGGRGDVRAGRGEGVYGGVGILRTHRGCQGHRILRRMRGNPRRQDIRFAGDAVEDVLRAPRQTVLRSQRIPRHGPLGPGARQGIRRVATRLDKACVFFYRMLHPTCMNRPFRLAVYGKGGIGKSTVSANLSSCLGSRGYRVVQIGCDPKHDSTRLLLGGRGQTTVLDAVRSGEYPPEYDDIVETGENGVLCVEAGGPRPGVGCGGRGVLTTFENIERLGIGRDADFRICDVLGDVVCGGFAVPMREENSDAVAIVTSGEFMSVYAANNIMRGLMNFGRDRPRLLGLILNSRGDDDPGLVERLSEATGAPIIARIPRSEAFARAEAAGRTAVGMLHGTPAARAVEDLADIVVRASEGAVGLCTPHPLDDAGLGILASGGVPSPPDPPAPAGMCPGHLFENRAIIGSCSPAGALAVMNRVKDVEIILHGPRNCGFTMGYAQNREYINGRHSRRYPSTPLTEHVRTSEMDDTDSIFGGADALRAHLEACVATGRPAAVIGTCVSGIIGDDSKSVVEDVRRLHPDAIVMHVPTDGAVSGNKWEGYNGALEELAKLIEPCDSPDPDAVNLICHTFKRYNGPVFGSACEKLLVAMGLRLNTRFVDVCTTADIRRAGAASMDIMLYDDDETRFIASLLERRGMRTFPLPMPRGMSETRAWVAEMGSFAGREDEAAATLEELDRQEALAAEGYGRFFDGRRTAVYCAEGGDADWICDALEGLGSEVLRVFVHPALDDGAHIPSRRDIMIESSKKAVLGFCKDEGVDFLASDRRIPGAGIPQMTVSRAMIDPFDYNGTARMLWLQTRAGDGAGWRRWLRCCRTDSLER